MIAKDFITEWRQTAPWILDAQVEQDLVISRALVEIFQKEELARRLAFRGGTALYKLYLLPPARYSEDIDLVQLQSEPIGDTLSLLREVLDPWLGTPKRRFHEGRVSLIYRFSSEGEPPIRLRLKVEINSREHFSVLGTTSIPFTVDSRWFSGSASLTTYTLEELLGTKLRALYQRKKGRDLFDLWWALKTVSPEVPTVLRCFYEYMEAGEHHVTRANFEKNLLEKGQDSSFVQDIIPLLHPDISWNFEVAMQDVLDSLITELEGEPWKGLGASDGS